MNRWWHVWVLKHNLEARHVSPPMWDPSAQGVLVTCTCGKAWAL